MQNKGAVALWLRAPEARAAAAHCELRLQSVATIEPGAGTDTTRITTTAKRSEGLSIFVVDMRLAIGHRLVARPITTWHETNELFFENLEIAADYLIATEGQGLRKSWTARTPNVR